MKIIDGFDEKALKEIAKATGNKQLVKDVAYMRVTQYHQARRLKAERLENIAFFIGYHNADHFRLVGIGCRKEQQGKGYGRFMLYRAVEYARKQGYSKIRTRTMNGVDFYQKCGGARIIGMKDDDFLMEMDI